MKKILIATDHSTAARDATRYGKKLAETFEAKTVEVKVHEGGAADAILAAAAESNADLIIAGMKHSNKGMHRLFGSTVTALAQKTTHPLLIVPEGTPFVIPTKIV